MSSIRDLQLTYLSQLTSSKYFQCRQLSKLRCEVQQDQDRGSSLKVQFRVSNVWPHDMRGHVVKEIKLNRALIRFKFEQEVAENYPHHKNISANNLMIHFPVTCMISTKFQWPNDEMPKPIFHNDKGMKLNIMSCNFGKKEEFISSYFWSHWSKIGSQIGTISNSRLTFEPLVLRMVISRKETVTLANLYHDEDTTDFYLNAPKGRVAVHKACLAAHSDVFKAMLSKEWKETADGQIDLPGATLETLDSLKRYIYLSSLPGNEEVLRQLLIFASCYMMEALKAECISKLTLHTKSKNLHSLVEFACQHNLPELMIAILEQTPDEVIKEAHEEKFKQEVSADEGFTDIQFKNNVWQKK